MQITLNIGGYNYEINYNPQEEKANKVAKVFCRQNAHIFGVTAATMSSCTDPITARLMEVEQEEIAKLKN